MLLRLSPKPLNDGVSFLAFVVSLKWDDMPNHIWNL